ncbi:MAG TPA: hypothetical protein PKA77_03695 [Chitinophagaceae bacterium]|jgi:hypothetical protein|nr:hypothetical protein [Chitinophagaceae bacterium]HMU57479.1 hypothetical protein [Chitinophagaceae bacterium]
MKLTFKPWVGKKYYKQKTKILLLGESHYTGDNPYDSNLTIETVSEFLDGHGYKFFAKMSEAFAATDDREFWETVAFANLIQNTLYDPRSQPTEKDKATIKYSFPVLLDELCPQKVVVFSLRTWIHWLPDLGEEKVGSIKVGKRHSNVWKYVNSGGNSHAIGVCHASRMYGRNGTPEEWGDLIRKFLLNEWDNND